MKLVALIILLHSIKCYYSHVENATIWVSRRYSLDFYNREPGKSSIRCDVNRPTYMVEQRQCVKNEDLFDECRFALNDSLTFNRTIFWPYWTEYTGMTIIDTAADKQKNMTLNISMCQVASLEVYRGMTSIFEINHSGFTLMDRNTIQVDKQELAYSSSEYMGELFRMKISCPHGQIRSECLFFKVGGNTTVIESKFNCTVPGTLSDYSADCPSYKQSTFSITKVPYIITSNPTLITATNLTVPNENQPSKFEVGSRLFNIVVGAGGGMVMLLVCSLCCVCVVFICRQQGTKVSGITSSEMERRISTASRQAEAKNNKEMELAEYVHMYAVPSEVIRSNVYGSNHLEDNPDYLKSECGYAIIPPEKSLEYLHDEKEEPLYQEILPKAHVEMSSSLSQRKEIPPPHSIVTAENDFYQTSLHLQQLPLKGDSILH